VAGKIISIGFSPQRKIEIKCKSGREKIKISEECVLFRDLFRLEGRETHISISFSRLTVEHQKYSIVEYALNDENVTYPI
jgi:hypothetical protein